RLLRKAPPIVDAVEAARSRARVERGGDPQVEQCRPQDATLFPTARADVDAAPGERDAAQTAQPARDPEVLAEGDLGKAADALEVAPANEEPRVSVRRSQNGRTQCGGALDPAVREARALDPLPEDDRADARIVEQPPALDERSLVEPAVRVQEEQPIAARPRRARVHLRAAARARADDRDAERARRREAALRAGAATAVDDDDLLLALERDELRELPLERRSVVEDGDHDARHLRLRSDQAVRSTPTSRR